MAKYGKAAVQAVKYLSEGLSSNPVDAWRRATQMVFPNSITAREKGCPRGAFLGLCEEGLIRGVRGGNYTKSKKNKIYAIKGVEILRENPALENDPKTLWQIVIEGKKTHNQQMDVVIALWENNLFNI